MSRLTGKMPLAATASNTMSDNPEQSSIAIPVADTHLKCSSKGFIYIFSKVQTTKFYRVTPRILWILKRYSLFYIAFLHVAFKSSFQYFNSQYDML